MRSEVEAKGTGGLYRGEARAEFPPSGAASILFSLIKAALGDRVHAAPSDRREWRHARQAHRSPSRRALFPRPDAPARSAHKSGEELKSYSVIDLGFSGADVADAADGGASDPQAPLRPPTRLCAIGGRRTRSSSTSAARRFFNALVFHRSSLTRWAGQRMGQEKLKALLQERRDDALRPRPRCDQCGGAAEGDDVPCVRSGPPDAGCAGISNALPICEVCPFWDLSY
jgi:hypothetical protein